MVKIKKDGGKLFLVFAPVAHTFGQLLLVFRKQSGQRNQNNCNQNQSPGDVKSFQWSDIDSHKEKLLLFRKKCWKNEQNNSYEQQSSDNVKSFQRPYINSHLFTPFNWELFNDRFIANDDTMDRMIQSRVYEISNQNER